MSVSSRNDGQNRTRPVKASNEYHDGDQPKSQFKPQTEVTGYDAKMVSSVNSPVDSKNFSTHQDYYSSYYSSYYSPSTIGCIDTIQTTHAAEPCHTSSKHSYAGANSSYYSAGNKRRHDQITPNPSLAKYDSYSTSKGTTIEPNTQKVVSYQGVDPLAPPLNNDKKIKHRTVFRKAGGKVWQDSSLLDWPEGDFRIFVGNLGNEVDDATLQKAFSKYSTLAKWRVVRDPYQNTKGFGFVSFLDPHDGVKALKEMNGRYIGQRPCKLTKSTHEERTLHKNNTRK